MARLLKKYSFLVLLLVGLPFVVSCAPAWEEDHYDHWRSARYYDRDYYGYPYYYSHDYDRPYWRHEREEWERRHRWRHEREEQARRDEERFERRQHRREERRERREERREARERHEHNGKVPWEGVGRPDVD